jgi:ankyrin repeat protein
VACYLGLGSLVELGTTSAGQHSCGLRLRLSGGSLELHDPDLRRPAPVANGPGQPQFPTHTAEPGEQSALIGPLGTQGAAGITVPLFPQCCQTLLSHHVDPSLRDEDGYTAADLAEYHGHQDCAQYLREMARPVRPW